jgi:prepilin-type N-terminal cleavage/methylation domain-containing protein
MRSSQIARADRRAFTLVELLVVIFIIVLISAATLPAILPALNQRRVSEGSRLIQAELSRQRDMAVRANAPRGFRLLPDPFDPSRPNVLTSSRLIAIEPAPDYSEGEVYRGQGVDEFGNIRGPQPRLVDAAVFPQANFLTTHLRLIEKKRDSLPTVPVTFVPHEPTSWYWNLRQGDKIRLSDSGRQYTIVGPMLVTGPVFNPERFINSGLPAVFPTGPGSPNEEVIFVLNGQDDDGDGFVDEQLDGIDNDGDGIIDPGFNGIDDDGINGIDDIAEMYLHRNSDGSFSYPGFTFFVGIVPAFATKQNEFEFETFTGKAPPNIEIGVSYTVQRRPVPVEGARDVAMPTNVVVDLTTWDVGRFSAGGVPERSRLPVDPFTGFVDVMMAPNGQVLIAGPSSNASPPVSEPFYHFWITEREDVNQPDTSGSGGSPPFAYLPLTTAKPYRLPMPRDTGNDGRMATAADPTQNVVNLKKDRRLLSINTRSGAITSTAIETFYVNNPSFPYEAAESGQKDVQP